MVMNKALLAAVALATTMIIMMARPSVQESVYITNHLTKRVLIVHCRSTDTDLGAHAVAVGASFHWNFRENIFGGTFFWCKLAVEDKRIYFLAYDEYVETFGTWFVCDDGVYGTPASRPAFLKAAWTRP
ncbi:unnamed protein product [Linum tenue]|uniref:S-protein homolog n=1 Tax=Linum tenue TaxID=586396 RepID=A0AAV0IDS9_9ROSI|nr:unnamed protein product [Linum tenue]